MSQSQNLHTQYGEPACPGFKVKGAFPNAEVPTHRPQLSLYTPGPTWYRWTYHSSLETFLRQDACELPGKFWNFASQSWKGAGLGSIQNTLPAVEDGLNQLSDSAKGGTYLNLRLTLSSSRLPICYLPFKQFSSLWVRVSICVNFIQGQLRASTRSQCLKCAFPCVLNIPKLLLLWFKGWGH